MPFNEIHSALIFYFSVNHFNLKFRHRKSGQSRKMNRFVNVGMKLLNWDLLLLVRIGIITLFFIRSITINFLIVVFCDSIYPIIRLFYKEFPIIFINVNRKFFLVGIVKIYIYNIIYNHRDTIYTFLCSSFVVS